MYIFIPKTRGGEKKTCLLIECCPKFHCSVSKYTEY